MLTAAKKLKNLQTFVQTSTSEFMAHPKNYPSLKITLYPLNPPMQQVKQQLINWHYIHKSFGTQFNNKTIQYVRSSSVN